MTMAVGVCLGLRDRFCDRCFRFFPCLSNPARRSSLCVKVVLVVLHLTYVGFLFLIDRDLIDSTKRHPWYTALYLMLFVATLVQYFLTVGSSPGYVVDAMRALNERESLLRAASAASKQPSTSKDKPVTLVNVDENQLGRSLLGSDTSWEKLVMEMYPRGSSFRQWTCTYCSVLQPPRAKHCHDCDKCVLQFDHHCVWLGTCIGQGNHCRFWWYICEETVLCIWTGFLYVAYLKANISRSWWMDTIMILLLIFLAISLIFLVLLLLFHRVYGRSLILPIPGYFVFGPILHSCLNIALAKCFYLVLTNQTTYELVRRRRVAYMRAIPERVYPFSEGICRNLYNFCFVQNNTYRLERLPTPEELEAKARPYTCHDLLCCRCC